MAASEVRTKRVQVLSTILLAVAAVATAWCSYQASRWTAEYRAASGRTNAIRLEAARAQGLAEAEKLVDVATFTQWVDAYALRRTALADFYFRRFRKEFRPAVVAWLKTKPLTIPDAPLTPFAMPQYELAAVNKVRQLDAEAELSSAKGSETTSARRTTSSRWSSAPARCSSPACRRSVARCASKKCCWRSVGRSSSAL